ncbi:MAG: hypothetical protein WCC87_18395 [Candidatus Korobacteraceae bacterium]
MTMTTLDLLFAGAAKGPQHNPCLLAVFTAWARPAWLAWDPCLPYLTGVIILALGLAMFLKKEAPHKHGLDRIVALGPMLLAVPLAVFGGEHLIAGQSMAGMVPSWIPGHLFWIYFVGVCLLLAALSLVLDRYAGLAAALFGIMLLLFEVLLHIPLALSAPGNRFFWAVVFRELIFSSGALALAATYTEAWRKHGKHPVITIVRFVMGVGIVFFGVEQLLHPEFVPAVPLNRLTPNWIPMHLLWGYPVGVVFVVAGLCLILNQQTRRAATWLGLTILLTVVIIYVPINIASAADIGKGLNYLADTLLLGGAVLAFAGSQHGKLATQNVLERTSARGVTEEIPF